MSAPGRRTGFNPGLLKREALDRVAAAGQPRIEVRDLRSKRLVHTVLLGSGNRRRAEKVLAGMEKKYDLELVYLVPKCLDKESC